MNNLRLGNVIVFEIRLPHFEAKVHVFAIHEILFTETTDLSEHLASEH